MVKIPFVQAYKSRGRTYYYYRRDKQRQRIDGEFGSDEWWSSYKAINRSFEDTGRLHGVDPESIESVIRLYLESDAFQNLKPSTKPSYRRVLEDLRKDLGLAPIKHLTRKVIVQLRDRIAKKHKRKAMRYVTVIKVLIECALDHGILVGINPAEGIKKPAGYVATPYRPWTDEEIGIFMAGAKPLWRRAMIVLLYTGLRRDDAVQLQRKDIKDGRIRWVPGKTEDINPEPVVITIHSTLAEELAKPLPVTSLYLIQGVRGGAINKDRITHEIRDECLRLGISDPPPLHGLRKNAVRALREAGCTVAEINAITGQSEQMIKHYSKGFDRTELADNALLKWERKSTANRPKVSNVQSNKKEED